MQTHLIFKVYLLLLLGLVGCQSDKKDTTIVPAVKKIQVSKLVAPTNNTKYKLNDTLRIKIVAFDLQNPVDFDSINIYINNKTITKVNSLPFELNYPLNSIGCGRYNLEYTAFLPDGKKEMRFASFEVLSPNKPKQKDFVVMATFPHDVEAYTQGLEWDENDLYESTGQIGQSSLRLVNHKSGEVIRKTMLPDHIFGEGITIWNDLIYQISWRAQTGFIYQKDNFELKGTFNYKTEGWGLTHDEQHLIMSDGSEKLYFLDKETFKVEKEIQVYDDQNSLRNLNELEYVDGLIYANIYQSMIIAAIDPKTGEVLNYISMRGILDPEDLHDDIDVMNGIAYKKESQTFYLTGKYWPKLFEVRFVDKK